MTLALDLTTLGLVNGLIVVVCGIAFLLETVFRRSDEVGRFWSMFFVGMIFALFSYVIGTSHPDAWWAYAAGNGAFVVSLGFVWIGARRANKRRAHLWIAVVAGLVTFGSGLIQGPGQGYWTAALELFVGATVFCGLSAWEFARGTLRRFPSARVLAVGLAVMTAYYLTRAVFFVLAGPDDPTWDAIYGAATSTLIETALTALGAMTLSSIQADRFRRSNVLDADYGTQVKIDGMLAADEFRAQAESWLLRSIRSRSVLVLLMVELADLAEVNLAFGRASGDAAIRLTGRLALTHAPTAALVAHLSPRRFAILMELPTDDSVAGIADRIGDAVLSTPIDEQDRFRASTFRGIASTRSSGARYDDLFREAADAVAVDKASARALAEEAAAAPLPEPKLTGN